MFKAIAIVVSQFLFRINFDCPFKTVDDNLISERRTGKKGVNTEIKCKVCSRKAVNDLTCSKCGDMFHYKCDGVQETREDSLENWLCQICQQVTQLKESFSDVQAVGMSEMEIKSILRENPLLKKLLCEMEEKETVF